VSRRVLEGEAEVESIPERRPQERPDMTPGSKPEGAAGEILVWRCKVCGYLCAREAPPETCPICKVGRERFELFNLERGP
jgi:rubrerythrin